MKELILLRGLPGSGKTTVANIIETLNGGDKPVYSIATDEYFEVKNDGKFDPSLLDEAHKWTEDRVRHQMSVDCPVIIVHNTFTQRWEMQSYRDMARMADYRIHTLICENRHGGESTSDVPQKTVDKMHSRFQIKLQ